MKAYFDHEKLDVYREAINFCGWVGEFLSTVSAKTAVKDQLDRASTSVPLNIAEENGKFSPNDRARFFEIARGSALECATALDVLVARRLVSVDQITAAKVLFALSKCWLDCYEDSHRAVKCFVKMNRTTMYLLSTSTIRITRIRCQCVFC